jgi:hypothetical protein
MAGREPPHMGPMAHGFAALGEAAERAVSTISALAADAGQVPSRLGNIARLLTADGKLGTVWQVTLPFASHSKRFRAHRCLATCTPKPSKAWHPRMQSSGPWKMVKIYA